MTRNLETLIEQYNRASELDRTSRIATGETFWAEVDGVRTTMVRTWINELSLEEKATFETYITKTVDNVAALIVGRNYIKDAWQKIFSSPKMGNPI